MGPLFTVGRFRDDTSRRRTALLAEVGQWTLEDQLADPVRSVDVAVRAARPAVPRLDRAAASFTTNTAARLTVTVLVPYAGDGAHFAHRPSDRPELDPPVGDWHRRVDGAPVLGLPENFAADVDATTVRVWAAAAVDTVEAYLVALRGEAEEQTARLHADLTDLARRRAEDLRRREALAAELGRGI